MNNLMKNKWMITKETGQLYFEKTLVMTTRPFVFICKNDKEKKYLCMELDYSIFEYAIAEVTDKMLDDMIHDKVSMEDTLRHCVVDISVNQSTTQSQSFFCARENETDN